MGEMGADPIEAPGINPQHPSSNLQIFDGGLMFEVFPVLGAWMLEL
jgi:hypothetical protein